MLMMMLNIAAVLAASFAQLVVGLPQTTMQDVAIRASTGCGKTQWPTDFTHYRFGLKSSGKDRSYSYHIPANYDQNKPYPVVIGFHGSSSIGLFLELDTKLSQSRYSADKIVVYPNGLGGSWAGPSYHTDSTVQEDIQFVADLIADVKANVCVDEDRIFATGMSNGGGFIGTLACDPLGSTLFKAYASHSGAFYTDINGPKNNCNPSPQAVPIPILEIHGGNDSTVHYEGGQGDGGPEPAIPDWLNWWAERNGCGNKTEESLFDGEVQHLSWSCGGVDGSLQHYKVASMGHCWADTEINLSQISVPQGPTVIRASEIIMAFFDSIAKA